MNRDIEIEHNMKLRRPQWQILAGQGWMNGDQECVVAARFGPKETVIAKATWPQKNDAGTELSVSLMVGTDMRRASKKISEPLTYLTEASLVQHWGRMVSAAKEWPWSG